MAVSKFEKYIEPYGQPLRLSVNLILYVFCYGQGQALSLRFNVFSNLITAESSNIFANSFGGSKPPPYHVVVCFAKDGLIGSNPIEKLNKKQQMQKCV